MNTGDHKRIAIAKACGWTYDKKNDRWISPTGDIFQVMHGWQTYKDGSDILPNYLCDRNAISDAWNVWMRLPHSDQAKFAHHLSVVIFGKGLADGKLFTEHDLARIANASAADLAEAFLVTIGYVEPAELTEPIKTLSEWSGIVHDYKSGFINRFCPTAGILLNVFWNDECMFIRYVLRCGRHVRDSVKITEWLDFLNEFKTKQTNNRA